MIFRAIFSGFFDKVDVVDYATGITLRETDFSEDSANAAILDIEENPGDAEGRLMREELKVFLEIFLGRGVLGRSSRRLVCGHCS